MLLIIGNFVEPSADDRIENLLLSFMPGFVPLQRRWRNNGLSADFLADYVTTFFPKVSDDPKSDSRQLEIKGAVSYIANELLENAMRYCDGQLANPIIIQLQLESDRIIFNETNSVQAEGANAFRAFIQRMEDTDPMTLLVEQMEANAQGGESSGLGLLTMVNDYGARLSWKFLHHSNGTVTITTQVQLDI